MFLDWMWNHCIAAEQWASLNNVVLVAWLQTSAWRAFIDWSLSLDFNTINTAIINECICISIWIWLNWHMHCTGCKTPILSTIHYASLPLSSYHEGRFTSIDQCLSAHQLSLELSIVHTNLHLSMNFPSSHIRANERVGSANYCLRTPWKCDLQSVAWQAMDLQSTWRQAGWYSRRLMQCI